VENSSIFVSDDESLMSQIFWLDFAGYFEEQKLSFEMLLTTE
jgi:hypothetical protein